MTMRSRLRQIGGLLSLLAVVGLLSSCAAVHTSIAKKDLDVQTKMSESVFLEPVRPDKKTIFIQIRNTSDKQFDLEQAIASAIAARDPGSASTTRPAAIPPSARESSAADPIS